MRELNESSFTVIPRLFCCRSIMLFGLETVSIAAIVPFNFSSFRTMSLYFSQALLSSVSASSKSAAATSTSAPVPSASGWSSIGCVSYDDSRLLTGACEY